MKLERLLGLLAMTGITPLALFLFFHSRHTDDISTVDPSTKTDLEQPILSVTKDFKILSESNFDFYVYRAHVLSSENNAHVAPRNVVQWTEKKTPGKFFALIS